MKKKAYLYERVSTKEQEEYGFSIPDQDRRLKEHCDKHEIEVAGIFTDDCTGKNFDRKGFQKLLATHKVNRADYILFTKWSRFSRNTQASYEMIDHIHGAGAEVQAIDEPIDLSIPQNYLLLAFHLSMPEVDNKIRSNSTTEGMREASKQGRYICGAPFGYFNTRDAGDKPIIVPDAERSYVIYKAFDLMATGMYSQNEVRSQLNKESGMNFTKSRFSVAMQNPLYCGNIVVKAYKKEPAAIIKGIHEAIIDEETFYTVQEVLKGNRRVKATRHRQVREEFPIIGYIHCEHGHKMTGSASTGRRGTHYHYYHCWNNLHCQREQAAKVNAAFENMLGQVRPKPGRAEVFEAWVMHELGDEKKLKQIRAKIAALEQRVVNVQDDFNDRNITLADFQSMRARYGAELHELREQVRLITGDDKEFSDNLKNGMMLLSDLKGYYRNATPEGKQGVISSIIEGKVYYSENKCRTADWKPAVSLLCNTGAAFVAPDTLQQQHILASVPYGDPDGTLFRTEPHIIRLGIKQLSDCLKLVA